MLVTAGAAATNIQPTADGTTQTLKLGSLFVISSTENVKSLIASYSTDGGLTWNTRTIADGTDILPFGGGTPASAADGIHSKPQVAADSFGNLFLVYSGNGNKTQTIAVSTHFGQTFTQIADNTSRNADENSIATGRTASGGEMFVAWHDSP